MIIICSHLGHLVIDFLVAKDKIPTSENIPFKKKDVAFWKCVAQKKY
jgi:hypothetical protein